jgi:hypothetical protein
MLLLITIRFQSNLESPTIWARIMQISTNRYAAGSKELEEAQAEYNALNSRIISSRNQQDALNEQEEKLNNQIRNEEFGTNLTPGLHVYGSHVNTPPLQ